MSQKLTKEQVQTEYNKTAGMLGEKVYQFCLPALEICQMMTYLLALNRAAGELVAEEKKQKPTNPETDGA